MYYAAMQDTSLLDQKSIEITLGSLLGDGSIAINKGYKNARFSFRHSIKQKDYFFWKVGKLKSMSSDNNVWEQTDANSLSNGWGGSKLRFQSLTMDELTKIHSLTTKNGKKIVKRKWLNQMTPLSLLIWWLDDGSIISNHRKGVFCTDSFSYKEVKILCNYMQVVWGIKTKVAPINRENKSYYRLWLYSTDELKKFLRIILPYLEPELESMLYKFLIIYNDSQLQQRWISEICDLTGFSNEVVLRQLLLRKGGLKNPKV